MENVRKHNENCDQRLKKELFNFQAYYKASIWFFEKLLPIKITKTKDKKNEPVYLGFFILDLSKIDMHEFWYDCIKEKSGRKAIVDAYIIVIHIKTENI